MQIPLQYAETVKTLIDKLLDKGYQSTVQPVLAAIASSSSATGNSLMALRLQQFNDEMKRLDANGEKLRADNPVLAALLNDFGDTLKRDSRLIDAISPQLVHNGIDAAGHIVPKAALVGLGAGVVWNQPDPEAIARIVSYTTSPAFQSRLDEFTTGTAEQVRNAALQSILTGQGPLATGRYLSGLVEDLPLFKAQSLTRTLQLTSYRDSSVAHGLANADILQSQIRIAVLDRRTCMSCVALHGTELEIDERVDDHEQGRCTSVFIVKGRSVDIQSGEDWFDNRSAEQQQEMMGGAAYRAWQDGAITLQDFPKPYVDPLFGDMIREASLKEMLGNAAKDYYKYKQ